MNKKKNYSVCGSFDSIKSVFLLLFMQNPDKFCLVAPVDPLKLASSKVERRFLNFEDMQNVFSRKC